MKRALGISALLLLSACEPQMIYVHDTMYVIPGYVRPVLVAVGVVHLALVVAFARMVWRIVRDRMRGTKGGQ